MTNPNSIKAIISNNAPMNNILYYDDYIILIIHVTMNEFIKE